MRMLGVMIVMAAMASGAVAGILPEGEPVFQTYYRGGTVRRRTGKELVDTLIVNARRRRLLRWAVVLVSIGICIGAPLAMGDSEETKWMVCLYMNRVVLLSAPMVMVNADTHGILSQGGFWLEMNESDPGHEDIAAPGVQGIMGDSADPDEFDSCISCISSRNVQLPLILVVDNDDRILTHTPRATWFHLLRDMDCRPHRQMAALYYDELHYSNAQAAKERLKRETAVPSVNPETKEKARQRVLFERPVMGNEDAPKLYHTPAPNAPFKTNPEEIGPGRIPPRWAGRAPKDFFSLLKAFLGVTLMGIPPEPAYVHQHLMNNPAFARACGFTPPDPIGIYRQTAVPALRTLEHFDQIMTRSGLWNTLKLGELKQAIESGVIEPDDILVHDTTHYHAHSSFEVLKYTDEKGKKQKKSAPKVRKHCGCQHKEQCPHEWTSADEGAGTVVKSSGMYWAHKASILSLGNRNMVLDAYAVTDAAAHDSTTLVASIERLFETLPEIKEWFDAVLDDGAADDKVLKKRIHDKFGIRLVCSQNPRRRKPITKDLPRGVSKITPYGVPLCLAGHAFDFKGVRKNVKKFIFGPPLPVDEHNPCTTCQHKAECCPNARTGRHLSLPYDRLPFIDPEDPPIAKRYKRMLAKRTSIERLIKMLKCDLGTDTLSKRGNDAFQARLDKTLFAYFILLRYKI